jgi:hypothetical protein
MMNAKKITVLSLVLAIIPLFGCTSYNPYTGRQEVDYAATAGAVGLAAGATALGLALAGGPGPRPNAVELSRHHPLAFVDLPFVDGFL